MKCNFHLGKAATVRIKVIWFLLQHKSNHIIPGLPHSHEDHEDISICGRQRITGIFPITNNHHSVQSSEVALLDWSQNVAHKEICFYTRPVNYDDSVFLGEVSCKDISRKLQDSSMNDTKLPRASSYTQGVRTIHFFLAIHLKKSESNESFYSKFLYFCNQGLSYSVVKTKVIPPTSYTYAWKRKLIIPRIYPQLT